MRYCLVRAFEISLTYLFDVFEMWEQVSTVKREFGYMIKVDYMSKGKSFERDE
jgi:hypothetical protein